MIETLKIAIIASYLALPFVSKDITAKDIRCMADNMYYESRGEPAEGIFRVGLVTYNRMLKADKSACEIVYQKIDGKPQFSWTAKKQRSAGKLDRMEYEFCVAIAGLILSGDANDISQGATHFDNVTPKRARAWFKHALKTGRIEYIETIGGHSFYRQTF